MGLVDAESIQWRKIKKYLEEREAQHLKNLVATDDPTVSAKLRGAITEIRDLKAQVEPKR